MELDRSPADEVEDDGDQGEEQQQVNEEAAYMKDEESAEPQQYQDYSQDKKHELSSFLYPLAP